MSDIFDYIFLYFASILLAILKITMIISWSWWIVALPTIIGLVFHCILVIASW